MLVVVFACCIWAQSFSLAVSDNFEAFSYSPDSMPIVQVRLAPPRKPMAEVAASLNKLETEREQFENDKMVEVEIAYNRSLEQASKDLPASIGRLMGVFQKPSAWMSIRQQKTARDDPPLSASFKEGRSVLGGHKLTTRINVLPIVTPAASLEPHIKQIEAKRTDEEGKVFDQAKSEMDGLTRIVQNEVEAHIAWQASRLLHALKFDLHASSSPLFSKAMAVGFLEQRVLTSGSQLTTNVRVIASEEPFYTVSSMVEGLERKRDTSEELLRKRLLELELKLLQTENGIVSSSLGAWIEHILHTSM